MGAGQLDSERSGGRKSELDMFRAKARFRLAIMSQSTGLPLPELPAEGQVNKSRVYDVVQKALKVDQEYKMQIDSLQTPVEEGEIHWHETLRRKSLVEDLHKIRRRSLIEASHDLVLPLAKPPSKKAHTPGASSDKSNTSNATANTKIELSRSEAKNTDYVPGGVVDDVDGDGDKRRTKMVTLDIPKSSPRMSRRGQLSPTMSTGSDSSQDSITRYVLEYQQRKQLAPGVAATKGGTDSRGTVADPLTQIHPQETDTKDSPPSSLPSPEVLGASLNCSNHSVDFETHFHSGRAATSTPRSFLRGIIPSSFFKLVCSVCGHQ